MSGASFKIGDVVFFSLSGHAVAGEGTLAIENATEKAGCWFSVHEHDARCHFGLRISLRR
jgi:hypothetical protein